MSNEPADHPRSRRWLADVGHDLRYAVRTIRRSPAFALVAVLTLGLGIGATTAIFSVVDTILLRPLPFRDSDRLVSVAQNMPPFREGAPSYGRGFTRQEFAHWREGTTTLSEVAAIGTSVGIVKTTQGTARLWGASVSGTTFPMLGAHAMLGRVLVASDEANPNVVLLSFESWHRLYQGDPDIVGKPMEFLSGDGGTRPKIVVGVMPPAFEFPTGSMEYFVPLDPASQSGPQAPRVTIIGLIRPGVAPEAASQEALTLGAAIAPPLPADALPMAVPRFELRHLKHEAVKELRPALRVFLAAVAVVLMIVCANVANLLLARGSGRQREIAVRSAIGASRGRIVRQILAECVVLAAAGGVLGAVLGAAGLTLVKQLASIDAPGVFRFSLGASILPRIQEIGIDPRLFGIAFVLTALAGVTFALLPALHLSSVHPLRSLATRAGGASRGASRLRSALVVGQIVMATVLLVGAGLLIHSFGRLLAVDRGYDASNALAFQLVFPPSHSIARKTDTIERILARLRASPDVTAAGFSRHGMLIGEQITIGTFVPEGRALEEMRAAQSPSLRPVTGGYLTAVGARMVQGTDLNPLDAGSPPAIVISRSTARIFGPGRQIGRLVEWHWGKARVQLQVVGVVNDLRNTKPDREPFPEVFINYRDVLEVTQRLGEAPLWQHERALGLLSFAVRTRGEPAAAQKLVSGIVAEVDPGAGIDSMRPLDQLVASSVARPRFYAVLLALFAGIAALLAAIGIYGVLAYAVEQRVYEIGIRMALGAQRRQVLALVLRRGVVLALAGLAIGIAAAAAGARLLQGMLFGVTPLDPLTFAGVALLFGFVALVASYLPAHRATRVDPMIALRTE